METNWDEVTNDPVFVKEPTTGLKEQQWTLQVRNSSLFKSPDVLSLWFHHHNVFVPLCVRIRVTSLFPFYSWLFPVKKNDLTPISTRLKKTGILCCVGGLSCVSCELVYSEFCVKPLAFWVWSSLFISRMSWSAVEVVLNSWSSRLWNHNSSPPPSSNSHVRVLVLFPRV